MNCYSEKTKLAVKVIRGVVLGVVVLAAGQAQAAAITGGMTLGGAYSLTAEADLSTTTSLTLLDVYGTGGGTGSLDNVTVTSSGVAGNSLVFPATAVTNLLQIEGWQVDILDSSIVGQTGSSLELSGTGTLFCADTATCGQYDPTAMEWTLSAVATGSSYSMTVTMLGGGAAGLTAVPVPAAVWLFGSGLIGLAGVARRKRG